MLISASVVPVAAGARSDYGGAHGLAVRAAVNQTVSSAG